MATAQLLALASCPRAMLRVSLSLKPVLCGPGNTYIIIGEIFAIIIIIIYFFLNQKAVDF